MAPVLHTSQAAGLWFDADPRRAQSGGGPPPGRTVWATAPGVIPGDQVRAPGDLNSATIDYERMPWVHQPYSANGVADVNATGLVNYTGSGPARLSLHMRTETLVPYVQGQSNTRNQDPHPAGYGTNDGTNIGRLSGNGLVHGLHTRVVGSQPATLRRTFVTPQQRPPRVNRLSNSRNAGQSYSQTTIHQGAGG